MVQLQQEYFGLLSRLQFREEELDLSRLEHHRAFLQQLARIKNSGIKVFDLHRREHVFVSYNFEALFGFDLEELQSADVEYFNARIHPEDMAPLMEIGIKMFRYYFQLPEGQRTDYKLINEYRLRKKDGSYTWVIEQHQALELDRRGQVWLALSVVDVSPNQENREGVNSQVLNFRTGATFSLQEDKKEPADEVQLTKRESEVLSLIHQGYLSKEISEMLSISLHTVNTHRQRILRKLEANNSMEAVLYAGRLGLLE